MAAEAHLSGSLPPGAEDPDHEMNHPRDVLSDVSFVAKPRQRIGIVGPTGAGKTMLLRALSRQWEIAPGTVFLDGHDVLELSASMVREAVGVVPQENFLFSATLAENIALGHPHADRASIEAAAEAAQLTLDLDQLSAGLDTTLGERGINLSGGQRQRTALARVALLRPKIVLLDDTLSAVDNETADRILRALEPVLAGATVILVAHRLSTVRRCEEILVLEEGCITERGTYDTLLAAGGWFAATAKSQAQESAKAADA